LKGWWCP